MVDLTHVKWLPNRFGGSESKWTIQYNDKLYMVKFPDPNRAPKQTSQLYINNHFSEYIGCHIFQMLGIPAQNTFLRRATPPNSEKEKLVVACEVFSPSSEGILIEFSKFFLHETDSQKRSKTTIDDVMYIIDNDVTIKNKMLLKKFFWEMFVVDAAIGNTDRHLDNWGVMASSDGKISPAPVYDCGSALSPLVSDREKEELLEDDISFKNTEYNLCSVYRHQGKRIFYHEILKAPPADLHRSILEIVPRIKFAAPRIDALIDTTEGMTDISKTYMKKSLAMRLNQMLLPALKKAQERQAREDGESRGFSR